MKKTEQYQVAYRKYVVQCEKAGQAPLAYYEWYKTHAAY